MIFLFILVLADIVNSEDTFIKGGVQLMSITHNGLPILELS